MNINWNQLANEAASQTDNEFNTTLASLTHLSIPEVDQFISESGINHKDAMKVIKEINNATASNEAKTNAIHNIDNGVNFLVSLASKII